MVKFICGRDFAADLRLDRKIYAPEMRAREMQQETVVTAMLFFCTLKQL
jgi:hypothetical protein